MISMDAVLTAPETRSSSPVRILRDETRQSYLRGLYPCGEGAGYAGGITSAALDGMLTAEAIINELKELPLMYPERIGPEVSGARIQMAREY